MGCVVRSRCMDASNKPSLVIAILLCAVTISLVGWSSPALAGPARLHVKHMPIEVYRDANGDAMQPRDRQFIGPNWSGYVLPSFQSKQHYTVAQATWTVPEVFFGGFSAASSTWIGIGGFCESKKCKKVDHTLIQLGTEQDVLGPSSFDYYAWYELIPASETIITELPVSPGDVITASLSCAGKCKNHQTWMLSMTDETTSDTWSQVVGYKSSKASLEDIEEAPSSFSGILPLADYDVSFFSDTTAKGTPVNFSKGDSLLMLNPAGESSDVSALVSNNDFAACYSPDSTFALCEDLP